MTDTYYDRDDICAAWYLYLCHHELYPRLFKLMDHFKLPAYIHSELDLDENARAIYDQLVAQP